jgi:hypothetical protein
MYFVNKQESLAQAYQLESLAQTHEFQSYPILPIIAQAFLPRIVVLTYTYPSDP